MMRPRVLVIAGAMTLVTAVAGAYALNLVNAPFATRDRERFATDAIVAPDAALPITPCNSCDARHQRLRKGAN